MTTGGVFYYITQRERNPGPQLPHDPSKKNVVVVGSGWGSTAFLKNLDTSDYNVTVISPRNFFLFTPLLPSVAVGTIATNSILQRRFSLPDSSKFQLTSSSSYSLPDASQGSKNHCHRGRGKICQCLCLQSSILKVLIRFAAHSENYNLCRCGFFVLQYSDSYSSTQMRRKFKARFHQPRYHLTTLSTPSARRHKHLAFQASRNMRVL